VVLFHIFFRMVYKNCMQYLFICLVQKNNISKILTTIISFKEIVKEILKGIATGII